jgi:hypothetical protein
MKHYKRAREFAKQFGSVVGYYVLWNAPANVARTLIRCTKLGVVCSDCNNEIVHGCYVEIRVEIVRGQPEISLSRCRSCIEKSNMWWVYNYPSCQRPKALCSTIHMTENLIK